MHAFSGHEAHVHGVDWLDRNTLVSGCEKGWMICHDLRSPQFVWKAAVNQFGICALASTPNSSDGPGVLLGLTAGSVCLYSPEQKRFLVPPTKVHDDDVRCVLSWETSVSSKSQHQRKKISICTTSFDSTGAVWDLTLDPSRSSNQSTKPFVGHQKVASVSSEYRLSRTASLVNGHTDKILCAIRCNRSGFLITTGADGRTVFWR